MGGGGEAQLRFNKLTYSLIPRNHRLKAVFSPACMFTQTPTPPKRSFVAHRSATNATPICPSQLTTLTWLGYDRHAPWGHHLLLYLGKRSCGAQQRGYKSRAHRVPFLPQGCGKALATSGSRGGFPTFPYPFPCLTQCTLCWE